MTTCDFFVWRYHSLATSIMIIQIWAPFGPSSVLNVLPTTCWSGGILLYSQSIFQPAPFLLCVQATAWLTTTSKSMSEYNHSLSLLCKIFFTATELYSICYSNKSIWPYYALFLNLKLSFIEKGIDLILQVY